MKLTYSVEQILSCSGLVLFVSGHLDEVSFNSSRDFNFSKIKYFRSEILDVKEKLQQYQIMFRNPEIQKQANEAMNAL